MRANHRHGDRRPSGWLAVNDDGKACATCKACGPDADAQLLAAIGLTFRDLYPDAGTNGSPPCTAGAAKRMRAGVNGAACSSPLPPAPPAPAPPPGANCIEYDYVDTDGELLYQVVRYDPKDFRQRRPDGKGGWVWSMKGVGRVLYRLPQLVAAPADAVAYVVEGEKAADVLASVGLVSTCSPGGAGKWSRLAGDSALDGRPVVILPDADEPGRRHAEDVAARLHGRAASVRVVEIPGLDDGEDVADLIAHQRDDGHDDPAIRRYIEDLAAIAPEWAPSAEVLPPAPPAMAGPADTLPPPPTDEASAREYVRAIFDAGEAFVSAGLRLGRMLAAFADAGGFELLGLTYIDPRGRRQRSWSYFASPMNIEQRRLQVHVQAGRLANERRQSALIERKSAPNERRQSALIERKSAPNERRQSALIEPATVEHYSALSPLAGDPDAIEEAIRTAQRLAEAEADDKGRRNVRVVTRHYRAAVAAVVPPKHGATRANATPAAQPALRALIAAALDAAIADPNASPELIRAIEVAHRLAIEAEHHGAAA